MLVYLEQKELTKNRKCYDIHTAPMRDGDTPESVYNKLSALSPEELRRKMKIISFGDFPANTIFVCTKLRVQPIACNGEDRVVSVMTYKTEIDGKALCGEMFLADRFVVNTKGKLPAIMLYKELKESKNGVS